MSIPRRAVAYLFLLIIIVSPVAALNTSVNPRIYFTEDVAVPFELWLCLIAIALVFFFISILSPTAISIMAGMAFACFGASAYAAPMVGYFNYELVSTTCTTTGITTQNVLPVVSLVNQPWVTYLLWGFAMLAFLNIFRGMILGAKAAAEQKRIAEAAEEETW